MKSILSYIIVLISALSYMVLFDARAGAMMFFFLVVTPFVSVFFTLMTRKKISLSVETDNESLKKGEPSKIFVVVKKNSFIPVPLITFSLRISPRFRAPEYEQYRFSMSEKKSVSIEIEIKPEICGPAYVNIDKIYISDYLGIFRFKIISDMAVEKNVFIRPEIAHLEENDELLRSIYNSIPENDDESSENSVAKTGLPGYEYREYTPGDSPKKINWKLSLKRNKLFVRLDEAASVSLPRIILDNSMYSGADDPREVMLMQEKIIECSLGLIMTCIRNGIECMYSYADEGIIRSETVSSVEDAEIIAEKLSRMNFDSDELVFPQSQHGKHTDINIIFTLDIDDNISSVADSEIINGNLVKIIVPQKSALINSRFSGDIWIISDNFTISRVV